ncbi:hypothetical protein [Qipengyuania soli]|uniref:Uncharacterized protein n=1 Tax=Qipengyuania soli TaxID=2782568 RepID=A0A7S8F472_9SPHN|nr:hypothetical protein [Qipengyuania soli]QPC98844.1 hypothetical protein IRL76_13580 [Qipengyuania soli]
MERQLPARLTGLAPIVLPLAVVALARAMTFTDWAVANTFWAALLFAWLVTDSLMLGTIAKAKDRRPGLHASLGALAIAAVVVLAGAAGPVRSTIHALPPLVAAAALTIALFLGWSALRFLAAVRQGQPIDAAAMEALPESMAPVVRFASAESRVMRLALFGWRRAQDIPAGAVGFSYHCYLLPMIWTLLVLQGIELAVMHFLLLQWNPTVAWIWFALGMAGGLWIMGLAQSFRIYPVLLTEEGLRVRSGIMIDVLVPYAAIGAQVSGFAREQVKDGGTFNQAVLSWPNVMLALDHPLRVKPLIGRAREVSAVAMRIDDSAAFNEALAARCDGAGK